jgi:thiosulfate dehydrogenase [quinone] large subunit
MNDTTAAMTSVWSARHLREHPLRTLGIVLFLLLRTLYGMFWLAAGINKVRKNWLTTDMLLQIYQDRLTEMHPDSFQVWFLQSFAIPLYKLVAWVVTCSELYVGIALLLGLTTRWAAGVAFFILLGLSAGGYYDASLIPFFLLALLMMSRPSGHWLGLDGRLSRKYPGARWFR